MLNNNRMSQAKKKDGKVTLGMLKGKPMTTSVPSITVKFHANAEQIEELYASDDEATSHSAAESKSTNDFDSSPFKYLNRLGKRSTSVDVSPQPITLENSSPPSDPWRFLSDIRGKITKSVEEKITEIKSRNQDEGSPLKKSSVKDSKENSSVSDSEDLSESSISKTCGINSTTEGAEMSSDDDTPSIEKDKKEEKKKKKIPHAFSQRFRFLRKTGPKEGTLHVNSLSKIYNINAEKVDQALPEHAEEVESAVEAFDDFEVETKSDDIKLTNTDIIKNVSDKIDNIEVDKDNVVTVKEVTGKEIRQNYLTNEKSSVIFAPTGHVDLREPPKTRKTKTNTTYYVLIGLAVALYAALHSYWPYFAGLMLGLFVGGAIHFLTEKLSKSVANYHPQKVTMDFIGGRNILEIPAVKEYQPLTKFEGWINEYPDSYSPITYHISKTQSAYLRLQGSLLRISHAKQKVPKRAMWNEPEIKANLIHHRIYNLLGAKVSLMPEGLAKIRHWSKKYPICVALSKDQMHFDSLESEEDDELNKSGGKEEKEKVVEKKEKIGFMFKKKEFHLPAQRFSKLTEEDYDLESDSRASSPSPDFSDLPQDEQVDSKLNEDLIDFDIISSNNESSATPDDSPTENKIYIFGRTDREKEDWFRRLSAATHHESNLYVEDKNEDSKEKEVENSMENEYNKYMQVFISKTKKSSNGKAKDKDADTPEEPLEEPRLDLVLWLNALIGRVLFDCMHDPNFTRKVQNRIQRKLSSIKLPYFIEELLVTELSLGKTSPIIHKAAKPILDERGLWVDLDLTYEGSIVLTLQTKLNLMKLKNPHANDKTLGEVKSAIYHSDVDDSAESSSDEEAPSEIQTNAEAGNSGGKKFIKMVDKITESRFFQAATENRLIKKAMEGVSNTDLRLKVEMRSLIGTMVLNMPTPPSDRIWVGFRPTPDIILSAQPIVGERNITFMYVTSWIEKKLLQEFQKIMVIPNMEDFIIPVMNPKLPE
ncbi:unnamed protein product [Brassicogethes aeneus]|uniref:SMP-LTD domain-containing protein n=1 Tax=Brassicogethes aeneus TaxID=1431903 RepID=A0A9P0BIE6_BRAAE|nr:unnamed protein product [Brassicogethes aeneus]